MAHLQPCLLSLSLSFFLSLSLSGPTLPLIPPTFSEACIAEEIEKSHGSFEAAAQMQRLGKHFDEKFGSQSETLDAKFHRHEQTISKIEDSIWELHSKLDQLLEQRG